MTFPVLPANGPSGYNLTNSLRFRSSATAYLNRTLASTSSTTTWTWSGWYKRGALATGNAFFSASDGGGGSGYWCQMVLNSSDKLNFIVFSGGVGSISGNKTTTAVYRDPSAWYHIVFVFNTTSATAEDRMQIWVNGVRVTAWDTNTLISQNFAGYINNSTYVHELGALYYTPNTNFVDGYMAEVNFIDGQALTPSSFGSTNAVTGVWQPAKYTGTYGTNGFYLPFTNTTSTTTLGNDFSGNGNNWTTNNISLTPGATYDAMTDVPTLTSPTAGNYCTWNPLSSNIFNTATDGNLRMDVPNVRSCLASIAMSSGKWYCEVSMGQVAAVVGVADASYTFTASGSNEIFAQARSYGYISTGSKRTANVDTAYGASWVAGDIIGIAYDASAGSLTFYKNGTSQGTAFTGISVPVVFAAYGASGTGVGTFAYLNAGQRPFAYTPPSGFVALNTFNLPNSTIPAGNKFMDATTYTGNGSTQSIVNSGAMQPDWVWIKERSTASAHALYDVLRGNTEVLSSNITAAGYLQSPTAGLASFNSTGFSVTYPNTGDYYVNRSGQPYIGWQWKGGGAGVTNTAGSITSTVSANTTSGFSVVTYTGTGSAATVGHGLNVAPAMIIAKSRDNAGGDSGIWVVYHKNLSAPSFFLYLNQTDAETFATTVWNNTAPTSTVFSIGSASGSGTASTHVAYCFAPIAGFSAFGSYVGNGSTDGPFVYTGFRPKFVLLKESSAAGNNWQILDTSRSTSNVAADILQPNASNAESAFGSGGVDFLSNGFKLRTSSVSINASSSTIIYACFAENPFRNALAR